MLIMFTVAVIAIYLMSSVGILALCSQMLSYPKGDHQIQSMFEKDELAHKPGSKLFRA